MLPFVRAEPCMSEPDPADALRWLGYSTEDHDVTRVLLIRSLLVPRHVCWLAQQTAGRWWRMPWDWRVWRSLSTMIPRSSAIVLPRFGWFTRSILTSRSLSSVRWEPGIRATALWWPGSTLHAGRVRLRRPMFRCCRIREAGSPSRRRLNGASNYFRRPTPRVPHRGEAPVRARKNALRDNSA